MRRTKSTFKNYLWSNVSTVVTMVLNFVNRTILIKTMGATYLGINSLFSNILGVLSFAELGIGLAISYSLYKPLAENDIPKIQAIISFFKKAYRIIGFTILIGGLVLIPFLPKIAKGSENVNNLVLLFVIYLINSVSSYFLTYKSTVITADQKNYLVTNIYTVSNIIIITSQIAVLLIFKNYVYYLLVLTIIGVFRNIFINFYTEKKYPYLKIKEAPKLPDEDRKNIFKNVKGLIYHQIGSVAITQTDNLIISSFINVDTVGVVSNYTTIIGIVRSFVSSFFNALLPSYGNIIATESVEYQHKVFKRLNFISFYLACVTSSCLFFLMEPFINIWIGKNYVLDYSVLIVFIANYYIGSLRYPLDVLSKSAGLFDDTKLSPIVESIINLASSIILVKLFGLIGVYIGTFLSSFVPTIWVSIVGYKKVFHKSPKQYYISYILRTFLFLIYMIILYLLFRVPNIDNNYLLILFRLPICLIIPCSFNYLLFRNNEEYKYLLIVLKKMLKKIKG